MSNRELDFLITEYLFGAIDEERRVWLEDRLLRDRDVMERLILIKRQVEVMDEPDFKPAPRVKSQIANVLFKENDRKSFINFDWLRELQLAPKGLVVASVIVILVCFIFIIKKSADLNVQQDIGVESLVDVGSQDFNSIDFL